MTVFLNIVMSWFTCHVFYFQLFLEKYIIDAKNRILISNFKLLTGTAHINKMTKLQHYSRILRHDAYNHKMAGTKNTTL